MDLAKRREGSKSARVRVKTVRGVLPRGFCNDNPAPQLGLFIFLVSLLLLKIHTCLMLVRLMSGCGPSAAWLVSRYHCMFPRLTVTLSSSIGLIAPSRP